MTIATAILESVLTCPECGRSTLEEMPPDSCRFFHECVECHHMLRPKTGDCCVFCSYGSVKCPPIQLQCGAPIARSHLHSEEPRSSRNE
jgi:hypothetical protein